MPSAREAVESELERDAFLLDAIDRGIVNAQGLADWLIKFRDFDHTSDALAKHIRDIQNEDSKAALEAPRAALSKADVQTLSDRTTFVFPRTDHVQQRLSRLIAELDIDSGDDVRLMTGERSVFLAVDETGADVAREVLGSLGETSTEGLVELRIDPANDGADLGLLGLVVEAMTVQGIDVVAAHGGASGAFVLVHETDRIDALRVLGETASG